MLGGARITLPTADSLQDAINAMIDFKIQDLEKQRSALLGPGNAASLRGFANLRDTGAVALEQVAEELTQAEQEAALQFREILSEVDPSSLEFNQPATIDGVHIPAKIVTDYLNALYNGTL
jgi:hypothetical protein